MWVIINHEGFELNRLEAIEKALNKLWSAHGVVVSGGAWERHVKPEIYHIYENIIPMVRALIKDKEADKVAKSHLIPAVKPHKKDRYEIRTGSFGQYFYDELRGCELTLADVAHLLNN